MKNKMFGKVFKVNIENLENNSVCEKLQKYKDSNLVCFNTEEDIVFFYSNGKVFALNKNNVEKYLEVKKDFKNVLAINEREVDYFKKSNNGNVTVCFIDGVYVGVSRLKGEDASIEIIGNKVAYNKAKIKKLKQKVKSNEEFVRIMKEESIKKTENEIKRLKDDIKKLEEEIRIF